jgi:hypothetical protein
VNSINCNGFEAGKSLGEASWNKNQYIDIHSVFTLEEVIWEGGEIPTFI